MSSSYPQHQMILLQLPPPPPPPPHADHVSSSSSSGSNNYSGGSSGGNSSSGGGGGGGSSGSGGGDISTSYPYRPNTTAYGSFMFLAIGVFLLRTFNFFKQHCTKLENSKRQRYLAVADTKSVGSRFEPYRDTPLRNRKRVAPSPKHPDIPNVPPESINTDTMQRLQSTGIKITAHGVHCDPRKVWLSMDEDSINWQSEFHKEVPDMHGAMKMVAVRGSLHRIPWDMVEYIDVGKRTDALKQATHVADHLCFSLLTPEGSLDLQASSQLERDSLVSCIGMQLDELLGGDWRQLGGGGTPSSAAGVSSASGAYSNSSFSTVPFADYAVDV